MGFGASGRWQGRFGHKETRSKPNPLPFQPMTPLHHFFIFPKSRFPLSFFKVLSPLASLKTFQCDFFFFFTYWFLRKMTMFCIWTNCSTTGSTIPVTGFDGWTTDFRSFVYFLEFLVEPVGQFQFLNSCRKYMDCWVWIGAFEDGFFFFFFQPSLHEIPLDNEGLG